MHYTIDIPLVDKTIAYPLVSNIVWVSPVIKSSTTEHKSTVFLTGGLKLYSTQPAQEISRRINAELHSWLELDAEICFK